MKKTIIIVLCLVLAMTSCFVLAACKSDSVTVTLMDGDKVLDTIEVEMGKNITLPTPTKANYTFVNWYADKDFADVYVADKVMASMTLYACFKANEYTVVINPNGGEMATADRIVKVYPGQAYELPVPTREGYTFAGYTYDTATATDVEFPTTGTYTLTDSVRVYAQWTEAQYTVSFLDGTAVLARNTVAHGTTIYAPIATKDGYNFAGWTDAEGNVTTKTSFSVTADATYQAKFEPKHYSITVENLETANIADIAFGAEYTLPENPNLPEGMKSFAGYTLDGEAFDNHGTYIWTTPIKVKANFERDPMYQKSRVTVYTAGQDVALSKTIDDGTNIAADLAALDTTKPGYNWIGWKANNQAFAPDTAINDDITIYAEYAPKTLLVIIAKTYAEPVQLTATFGVALQLSTPEARNGYKFLGYMRGEDEFDGSLTAADFDLTSLTITENWQQLASPDQDEGNQLFVKVENKNYFKERETTEDEFTYVFLTGYSYDLPVKSIDGTNTGNNAYMSWAPKDEVIALTMKQNVGTVTLPITRVVEGTDYTYNRTIKVVNNVNMDYGTDYSKVWIQTAQSSTDNFQSARNDLSVIEVGVKNFVPDVKITTLVGDATPALSYAAANVQVTVKVDGAETTDYTVDAATGAITFGDGLVGKTAVVTMAPKYATIDATTTFTLALNDGVNVYNNDELKANYALLSVSKINVLRNITAQMWDSDYDLRYSGGHTRRIEDVTLTSGTKDTVYQMDTGTPINDYSHSVYARLTTDTTDRIVINGNYFAIDGTQLPYVDNRYTYRDFDGGVGYELANVQIGIFLYRNYYEDADAGVHYRYQGGTLTINNLLVSGNNIALSDSTQDIGYSNPLLKMSASLNGLWCRGGTVNLNNVTIKRTNIAIATDSDVDGDDPSKHAVVINMTDCRLVENWGEDIYAYRITKFDLQHTLLGQATGGAAISFDERPQPSATNGLGNKLIMDAYTIANLNNWVSGGEAWFIAYGQTSTATFLQASLDGMLQPQGLTIIAHKATGDENYMNFAIYNRARGDNDGDEGWTNDPEHTIGIDITGLNTISTVDTSVELPGVGTVPATFTLYATQEGALFCTIQIASGAYGQIVGLPVYPLNAVPTVK